MKEAFLCLFFLIYYLNKYAGNDIVDVGIKLR